MNVDIPQNPEKHPFRKISITSFVMGGLSILLGIILLITVKSDYKAGYQILTIEKIIAGLGFITFGGKALWRGYQHEYDFNVNDVFDPSHGSNINVLLGQRGDNIQKTAKEYAHIVHGKSFSLTPNEKGKIADWQFIFYKLLSPKGISKLFNYVPYPITNFIANQSKLIAILGGFVIMFLGCLFISYLEIIPINMTWINLLILIGLLSLWKASKIDTVLEREKKESIRNRIILFITFYVTTILLYKPYAGEINLGLLISILLVAGIIVFTAILAFKLIEQIYAKREIVNVNTSGIDPVTHRAATQPNNILQQFENAMRSKGWYFRSLTKDARGLLSGDQNRKGDFEFEYMYETEPKIYSTTFDAKSEKLLNVVWKLGTGLICVFITIIYGNTKYAWH